MSENTPIEMKTKTCAPDDHALRQSAEILREGGLVAFPTETVYGIGADARNGQAVARIFEAKGRPSFNPLIVHVAGLEQAEAIAGFDARSRQVARQFWPGPLTLILPRLEGGGIADLTTAGLDTVAVRVPAHPVARKLIEIAGLPVAAPSANPSGRLSATTAHYVAETLGGKLDMILAGGAAEIGLESTVLDLSGKDPVILRTGAVTPDNLESLLGRVDIATKAVAGEKPKSPGQTLRHYAPMTPIRLNAVDVVSGEGLLAFGSTRFMGVKGGGAATDLPAGRIRNLSECGDLYEAAANLFTCLHELDRSGSERIAVMAIPETGIGLAINERLRRAAEAVEQGV